MPTSRRRLTVASVILSFGALSLFVSILLGLEGPDGRLNTINLLAALVLAGVACFFWVRRSRMSK